MARRFAPVTADAVPDLVDPCRGCVRWEVDPVTARAVTEAGQTEQEKTAWVSDTLLEWGSCGRILYVDDEPVGHVLYAPPVLVPRAAAFATAPVGSDAVLLTALRVRPDHRGGGLGRALVQAAAADLVSRGVHGLEAFGTTQTGGEPCVLPTGFLQAVGFRTVRTHPRTPRLRLDLRTSLSWRADVEGALGRLLGTVRPVPAGARISQRTRSGSRIVPVGVSSSGGR